MARSGFKRIPATRARIAIGGVSHETNTFVPGRTTLDDVRRRVLLTGDAMVHAARDSQSALGGAIAQLEGAGSTLLPLLFAWAPPGPLVAFEAYRHLQRELLERLTRARDAGGVDAVILSLHGALVAEGVDDGEGTLLAAVRQVVGPETPIVAALDFHANITPAMVAAADLLVGYDTYPHIDTAERGHEAARQALAMLAGGWRPAMALRRLPLLTPLTAQRTDGDTPWRAILTEAHAREADPAVVAITLAAGFPYADVPFAGASVVVAVRDDVARAETIADDLAARLWQRRHDLRPTVLPVDAAVRFATTAPGPVAIADCGDNPGAGAPGRDATLLLALAEAGLPDVAVGALHDPAIVAAAVAAGVGVAIEIELGVGGRQREVRRVPATVLRLGDGVFANEGPMARGGVTRLGRTALLDIGGVRAIFCERVTQTLDPGLFRSHGIDPAACRVLGIKSSVHFRAAFAPIVATIIEADCGGWSSADLASFPYRRLTRPIVPLDPEVAR